MNADKTDDFTFPTNIEGQPLAGKSVLIVVENLPLPFDRRVWQAGRGSGQRYVVAELWP